MTARFVDALRGYEYFLRLRGQASREEINDYLISQDRNPVSSRTYAHYLKLLSFGFRSYIPINKFDVFQSLGRIQIVSDRRGYGRDVLGVQAEISRNRSRWHLVEIVDRSPVGLGILVHERLPIRPGVPLWVRMAGYEDIPTVVVWRNHLNGSTELGVRATEFISRFEIGEIDPDPERRRATLRVMYKPSGAIKWRNIHRVVNAIDEILVGSIDFLFSVDEVLGSDLVIAHPTIASLSMPRGGEIEIRIDSGCAAILRVVFEKLEIWGLRKRKIESQAGQIEMSLINSRIEVLRNVVNLRQESEARGLVQAIVDGLEGPLKALFNLLEFPPGLLAAASPERAILASRILPAAIELIAGDDPDLEVMIRS